MNLQPDVWYRIIKPSRDGKFRAGDSVCYDTDSNGLIIDCLPSDYEVGYDLDGVDAEVNLAWLVSEIRHLRDEISDLRAEVAELREAQI